MSVSDGTGCCKGLKYMNFGCNGGQIGTTWKWLTVDGVVSGGNYEEE